MASAAAQMMFQCVFQGSISIHDAEIERRPFHRNCGCALHRSKGGCSDSCSRNKNISSPKKQQWNGCSLSIAPSKFNSQTSSFLSNTEVRNIGDTNETTSHSHGLIDDKYLGYICFSIFMSTSSAPLDNESSRNECTCN